MSPEAAERQINAVVAGLGYAERKIEHRMGAADFRGLAAGLVDAMLRDAGLEGYRLTVPDDRVEEMSATSPTDAGCTRR